MHSFLIKTALEFLVNRQQPPATELGPLSVLYHLNYGDSQPSQFSISLCMCHPYIQNGPTCHCVTLARTYVCTYRSTYMDVHVPSFPFILPTHSPALSSLLPTSSLGSPSPLPSFTSVSFHTNPLPPYSLTDISRRKKLHLCITWYVYK